MKIQLNHRFWVMVFMLLAVAIRVYYSLSHLTQMLPAPQIRVIQGVVVHLPVSAPRYQKFSLDTAQGRFKLSWYGNSPKLIPGQRWQLKVKIKPKRDLKNPVTQHYTLYLRAHGIVAVGYVKNGPDNQLLSNHFYDAPLSYVRYKIRERFLSLTPKDGYRDIMLALSLGDRSLFAKGRWPVFQATGTSHLVAISGLHVGLVAGLVFLLCRYLHLYSLLIYHMNLVHTLLALVFHPKFQDTNLEYYNILLYQQTFQSLNIFYLNYPVYFRNQ